MGKIQLIHTYQDIISLENLLEAWQEFIKGKCARPDVQEFERNLMSNIIFLHQKLAAKVYQHGPYQAFNISDPKPRNIHKATVRDRLLHHAIYRILYPFFNKAFIADSYSCRIGKGTHKALNRLRNFAYIVSRNNTKTAWVLKCDIKKFFASINHAKLLGILRVYIPSADIIWLLTKIINSFATRPGVGLPLGNLTSQLLVNIYMNEFDQFVKHELKAKYYIRYADDWVMMSNDKIRLTNYIFSIKNFLESKLRLTLNPNKVAIKTLASGIDWLGWVHFPDHQVLRTTTKRRMFRRMRKHSSQETLQSYLGLLRHGNAYKLTKHLELGDFNNIIAT